MKSRTFRALMLPFLTGSLLICSGCATANVVIPASLKAECESTVGDLSEATTVAHLGQAIVRGDGDLRVCNVKKSAIVAIAESQNRGWFSRLFGW